MRISHPKSSERGAALLIVLLLVASLSAIALTIVQTMNSAYQSALISSARNQILWFAIGAEDFAASKLSTVSKLTEGKITRMTPGFDEPIEFALPDGCLKARFTDGSNCFNLNALSQTSEQADKAGAINAAEFYQQLLSALEFDTNKATELVATLQDWIDGDTLPRPGGAETSYYVSLEKPYASANTFLVSPGELRAIKGYTKEVYRRIRPYVCTHPDANIGPFNINTMRVAHAPLLFPVFSGEIPVTTLETELSGLEGTVNDTVDDFFALPTFAIIGKDNRKDEVLSVTTTYFRLTGEVVYLDAVTGYEAVFARDKAHNVALVRRRLGVDE